MSKVVGTYRTTISVAVSVLASMALTVTLALAPPNLHDFALKHTFQQWTMKFGEVLATRNAALSEYFDQPPFALALMALAVLMGIQAALCYFPAFRYARAFYIVTGQWRYRCHVYSSVEVVFSWLHMFLSLYLPLMWIRPVVKNFFVNDDMLFTDANFASFRLIILLITITLRILLTRSSTQTAMDQTFFVYLSLRETGQLADNQTFLKQASSFFSSMRVAAALQWIVPLLLLASPVAMLMRRGAVFTGFCSLVFGKLDCSSSEPPVFHMLENNPLLLALIEFFLFCHCVTFALQLIYALWSVNKYEK